MRPEDQQPYRFRNFVWPVFGVLAGISFAIVGVADAQALPVVALLVAGAAALIGVSQPAWRGRALGLRRGRQRPRNRNR